MPKIATIELDPAEITDAVRLYLLSQGYTMTGGIVLSMDGQTIAIVDGVNLAMRCSVKPTHENMLS